MEQDDENDNTAATFEQDEEEEEDEEEVIAAPTLPLALLAPSPPPPHNSSITKRQEAWNNCSSVRHVCEINGVKSKEFVKRGAQNTETLEVFMTLPVELKVLHYFPNLRVVKIMKQPDVTRIQGFEKAKLLEALWICECGLTSTKGLESCVRLEKLILDNNQIRQIEGLSPLTNLRTLWLNSNALNSLDSVTSLINLRELWVCRNRIQHLGTSLSNNLQLTDLNLADNGIRSFKDVLQLSHLKQLTSLTLTDPHFGENPVCHLCNYQTLVTFHLSQLRQLDMRQLDDKTRELAQSIFLKKKMYYNVRQRALRRDSIDVLEILDGYLRGKAAPLILACRKVMKKIKNCDHALHQIKEEQMRGKVAKGGGAASRSMLQNASKGEADPLLCHIESRRREMKKMEAMLENRLRTMEGLVEATRELIKQMTTRMIDQLMLEYNTGGNFRLEEAPIRELKLQRVSNSSHESIASSSEAALWDAETRDMVKSAFVTEDFEAIGICGMEVYRVTKLHNRSLRQCLDSHKKGVIKSCDVIIDGEAALRAPSFPAPSTTSEYMFVNITETMLGDVQGHLQSLAEDGFGSPSMCSPAVSLSSSLWDVDAVRLGSSSASSQHQNNNDKDLLEHHLVGQLLIVKICRGRCLELEMTPEELQQAAYCPTAASSGESLMRHRLQGYHSVLIRVIDQNDADEIPSKVAGSKSGSHSLFFMLDLGLIVPEFMVDFEYLRVRDREGDLRGSGEVEDSEKTLKLRSGSIDGRLSQFWRTAMSSTTENDRYTIGGSSADEQDDVVMAVAATASCKTYSKQEKEAVAQMHPYSLPLLRFARKVDQLLQSYDRLHLASHHDVESQPFLSLEENLAAPLLQLTEQSVADYAQAHPSLLTALNLHGQSLTRIDNLKGCLQLQTLILSFNRIESIEGLGTLHRLDTLDLSYNQIEDLNESSLDGLHALTSLDLEGNFIQKLQGLASIDRYLPQLSHLNTRYNPVCRIKDYRLRLLRRLIFIKYLDHVDITIKERQDVDNRTIRHISIDYIKKIVASTMATKHESGADKASGSVHGFLSADQAEAASPTCAIQKERSKEIDDQANRVEVLVIEHAGLEKLSNLELLPKLRKASFAHNDLTTWDGFEGCHTLEELSLEGNRLTVIEGQEHPFQFGQRLQRLDLGNNDLTSMDHLLVGLSNLMQLSLENNYVTSLKGLEVAPALMELYAGNNRIRDTKELEHLRPLTKLIIADFSGNPICQAAQYRPYAMFRLRSLKVLDKTAVTSHELAESHNSFEGKLMNVTLRDKVQGRSYEQIQTLDLSISGLRDVELLGVGTLSNLKDLNLDHNYISSFSWIQGLPSLTSLSLKNNRIESFWPLGLVTSSRDGNQSKGSSSSPYSSSSSNQPEGLTFPFLEVLHLGQNRIADMNGLELHLLPRLMTLNLANNEISEVTGLEACRRLHKLVLNRNKIRQLEPNSLHTLTKLRELFMEENCLRSLSHFNELCRLQVLHLGNNRLAELSELEKFAESEIQQPIDINMLGNPIARRSQYRMALLFAFPSLQVIDGRLVTDDERQRARDLSQPPENAVVRRYFDEKQNESVPPTKVGVKYLSVKTLSSDSLTCASTASVSNLPAWGSSSNISVPPTIRSIRRQPKK